MSHGFRGNSTGPARQFVDFQRLLNKEGFSVLRLDLPNSGNSEGDFVDVSYDEWVETIVHFAKKYIELGYEVSLLGQSMGAAATVVATSKKDIKNSIGCILLWVPGVNAEEFRGKNDDIFEEDGQKYKGKYWIEAKNSDFFKCLEQYKGAIHLVYGEMDKYISSDLRKKVIEIVERKGESSMILNGQGHSPWEYNTAQEVFKQEIDKLKALA